jgi:hypothetical protein
VRLNAWGMRLLAGEAGVARLPLVFTTALETAPLMDDSIFAEVFAHAVNQRAKHEVLVAAACRTAAFCAPCLQADVRPETSETVLAHLLRSGARAVHILLPPPSCLMRSRGCATAGALLLAVRIASSRSGSDRVRSQCLQIILAAVRGAHIPPCLHADDVMSCIRGFAPRLAPVIAATREATTLAAGLELLHELSHSDAPLRQSLSTLAAKSAAAGRPVEPQIFLAVSLACFSTRHRIEIENAAVVFRRAGRRFPNAPYGSNSEETPLAQDGVARARVGRRAHGMSSPSHRVRRFARPGARVSRCK